MPAKIQRNDLVVVIKGESGGARSPGASAGRRGRVLKVIRDQDRVVVEGVNNITKHVRKSDQHPTGARLQKEAPIAISNVMLVCPACDRGVRVALKRDEERGWIRHCKRCNREIPVPR